MQTFRLLGAAFPNVEVSFKMKRGCLQVLWIPSLWNIHLDHPHLFQSLVSLRVESFFSNAKWREVLQPCSQSLKHLNIGFIPGDNQQVLPLSFPNLEVFELEDWDRNFPKWMIAPSTLKLCLEFVHSGLPSISELRLLYLFGYQEITASCPELQIFRFDGSDKAGKDLLALLRARDRNVKEGSELHGIKMNTLRTLIVSFSRVNAEALRQCRELVGEVVNLDLIPYDWEVEV